MCDRLVVPVSDKGRRGMELGEAFLRKGEEVFPQNCS
jgi:hypothetical protein